jgi:hypothetical protein
MVSDFHKFLIHESEMVCNLKPPGYLTPIERQALSPCQVKSAGIVRQSELIK